MRYLLILLLCSCAPSETREEIERRNDLEFNKHLKPDTNDNYIQRSD